jgi:hypothetical protein
MTISLEGPDLFSRIAGDFIKVEAGRWPKREPRA